MISNDKSMNYKIVGLDDTFISILVYMKEICFLKFVLSREKTCVSII
jgi:hypothetical protein